MKSTTVVVCLACVMLAASQAHGVSVTIDEGTQYQLIEGWGACAGMEAVATDSRAKAAYKELGCNIIRVAIEPCILMAPGGNLEGPVVELTADINENVTKFNWEHSRTDHWDNVVEWLAANALEPNRVKIVLSCWSPPHWSKAPTGRYVDTGGYGAGVTPFIGYCTTCDSVGGTWNDGTYYYDAAHGYWNAYPYCARFLAASCKSFSQNAAGIPVYALSIQNEVSYENPFNSCTLYNQARATKVQQSPITNYNVFANALKAVKDEFLIHPEISGVKMMGPHHATLGDSPSNPWGLLAQMNGVQAVKNHADANLDDYMSIYTHNYSAASATRAEMFAGHWYGIDNVAAGWAAWGYPQAMHQGAAVDGKQVWNSEFGGHTPSWTNMLNMATDMHTQLVWGHESAIIHWAFCEGSLTEHNLLATSQLNDPNQSMKYATFKHFSRYVRPGAYRVKATFAGDSTSYGGSHNMDAENALDVSAFIHPVDGRVTVVLVNNKTVSYPITIDVPTEPYVNTFKVFRSTSTERFASQPDLTVSLGQISLTVPAQCIVTLTAEAAAAEPPGAPSNPSPGAGESGVDRNKTLTWTAGGGSATHDVYFGTANPPPFILNTSSASYEMLMMLPNTTYYWQVGEKNDYGTTMGPVWSFTTSERIEIRFDAVSSTHKDNASQTISFTHTLGAGSDRMLIVGMGAEDAAASDMTVSSITFNGVPMTPVADSAAITGTSPYVRTQLFYMLEEDLPSAGEYSVAATYSGMVDERCGGAISLLNAAQQPPEAVATNTAASANAISTGITTLSAHAWLVDAVASGGAGSFTATAGQTERWDTATDSADAAGGTKDVATPGLAVMSWQHSAATELAHSVAAVAPVPTAYYMADLEVLAAQWLSEGPQADIDCSGHVDFTDFALMGENWQ